MMKPDIKIKVEWDNDCGEVLFEQLLPANKVWELVRNNPCADQNRYILPDGRVMDSSEFATWYTDGKLTVS